MRTHFYFRINKLIFYKHKFSDLAYKLADKKNELERFFRRRILGT